MIAKLYEGRPRDEVAQLIDRHGLARIVLAVLAAVVRRREPVVYEASLSDHIRRDIGLSDVPAPQRRL